MGGQQAGAGQPRKPAVKFSRILRASGHTVGILKSAAVGNWQTLHTGFLLLFLKNQLLNTYHRAIFPGLLFHLNVESFT